MVGSNRDKPRRESLAGSLVGGMSWGGVSVGSWIRDECVLSLYILRIHAHFCLPLYYRVLMAANRVVV